MSDSRHLGQAGGAIQQGPLGPQCRRPALLSSPGCGVEDFNKVLAEYSFITALHQTYGTDISQGGYASGQADDRPELRAYYLAEFGRKLKLELHCITSQAGSSSEASKVVSLIDKYVKMGQERLELTADLM